MTESATATVKWSKGRGGGLHLSFENGNVSITDGRLAFKDDGGLHRTARGLRTDFGETMRLVNQFGHTEKLRGVPGELEGKVGRKHERVFDHDVELEASVSLSRSEGLVLHETASTEFQTKKTRAGQATVNYSIDTSVSFERGPALKVPPDVVAILEAAALLGLGAQPTKLILRLLRGATEERDIGVRGSV